MIPVPECYNYFDRDRFFVEIINRKGQYRKMWQQLLELFEKADRPIKICEGDYTRGVNEINDLPVITGY